MVHKTPKNLHYWLVKSEPEVFSIDDLAACEHQTTHWDGVRNYQARNFMRDDMKIGDLVLFYHSNSKPPAVAGIARIVCEGYVDHTAFDKNDDHYDPKSKPEAPAWIMVDIQLVKKFLRPITLPELRTMKPLAKMTLLQRGSRLSVQPVSAIEFKTICDAAGYAF